MSCLNLKHVGGNCCHDNNPNLINQSNKEKLVNLPVDFVTSDDVTFLQCFDGVHLARFLVLGQKHFAKMAATQDSNWSEMAHADCRIAGTRTA